MLSKLFVTEVAVTKSIPDDDYIARLPAVRNLRALGGLAFHKPVTFFVGENGVGKSTLIEAIAVQAGFNAEGGSVNFDFSTRASHSDLYHYITLTRSTERPTDGFFLRAESFYNVASNIDELDRHGGGTRMLIESYGGKSLHEQSHGESFLSLVEHRFGGHGLYIRSLLARDYGIDLEAIKAEHGMTDVDDFDFICHVAFDRKPLTRRERANNVKKRDFLSKYSGTAREVLETLLDKYMNAGIYEIEKTEVLKLDPFLKYGKPSKIAQLFGGKSGYLKAVRELEKEIYSGEVG